MLDTRWTLQRHEPNVLKGAVAGLLGGLAASWVMNRFQAAVPAETFEKLLGDTDDAHDDDGQDDGGGDSEPATVRAAEAVSEGVLGHALTENEKAWAGPAVHYAFGSSVGAAYGALAEAAPRVTAGAGLPFGVAFWAVADEGAVPALGLSAPPWEHPPSTHVYALASHLIFGLAAEFVRRLVRHLL